VDTGHGATRTAGRHTYDRLHHTYEIVGTSAQAAGVIVACPAGNITHDIFSFTSLLCTTTRCSRYQQVCDLPPDAKVRQFGLALAIKEDAASTDVAVGDVLPVQICGLISGRGLRGRRRNMVHVG